MGVTEPKDIKFFKTQTAFRKWLEKNHAKKTEQWVGFHKRSTGKLSITWPESVDEALCFGWIDGIRKSIDENSYVIRFTPRNPKSIWSSINVKHVARLTKLGLIHPAGVKAFEARDEKKSAIYSYENKDKKLPPEYEKKFKANKKAWAYFSSQAPWYQRTASHLVISAKQETTRLRRLDTLIKDSEKGKRIDQIISPGKSK